METLIVSFVLNGLLGVTMYLMKLSHEHTKEELKDLKKSVENVKDTYYKKEDFKEFKEELWNRLDRMESQLVRKDY